MFNVKKILIMGRKIDPQKAARICELYKSGAKSKDICTECHCSTNTIFTIGFIKIW